MNDLSLKSLPRGGRDFKKAATRNLVDSLR